MQKNVGLSFTIWRDVKVIGVFSEVLGANFSQIKALPRETLLCKIKLSSPEELNCEVTKRKERVWLFHRNLSLAGADKQKAPLNLVQVL